MANKKAVNLENILFLIQIWENEDALTLCEQLLEEHGATKEQISQIIGDIGTLVETALSQVGLSHEQVADGAQQPELVD